MNKYIIRKMAPEQGAPALAAEFDPAFLPNGFELLDEAALSQYPWDTNGYRPQAIARVGWNERGLHVLMAAFESEIRCEVKDVGGLVCQDSCLELFLMPAPDLSGKYVNVEATPRAILHMGLGEGRHGREVFGVLPAGMTPSASRHLGRWWAVSYSLPAAVLKAQFGCQLESGASMRGNFYKCGDMTRFPHWGMWQPYALANPDFHRPELFGRLVLE